MEHTISTAAFQCQCNNYNEHSSKHGEEMTSSSDPFQNKVQYCFKK